MVKDLVCGIKVDEKNEATKSEYKGATHYFAKAAFDSDPEKYLKR